MRHVISAVRAATLLALFWPATPATYAAADQDAAPVRAVLDEYIRLYARETLTQWRRLFVPGFVAGSTNDDGSVTVRTLDEFFGRQEAFFATGQRVREELHDIRIARDGRLASVQADFTLFVGSEARRGKLMMLLIADRGAFRIQSLTFTYHLS